MSNEQALANAGKLVAWAKRDGLWVRVYISTAWVCPFEGPIRPERTIAFAEQLWEMGMDELAIADTIGHANPLEVGRLMEALGKRLDMEKLAVHLHDTQALGMANSMTAIQAGVRIHDVSIGGLGGCPFAPGAAGNMATEDLVFLAYKLGLGTGIDFVALWDVVYEIEKLVGRRVGGRIREWWESSKQLAEEGLQLRGLSPS
jgi:hydroxymethylglutaryl-CoA lyase